MTDARLSADAERDLIYARLSEGPLMLSEGAVQTAATRASKAAQSSQKPQRIAIIAIEGTLFQKAWESWWWGTFDGYDTIAEKVIGALQSAQVDAVVMRLDSPGGMVAGCFDCVRAIRAAATATGKPLIAFADELAASAAYALASAADKIVVPSSGVLGSIGVIRSSTDWSKMLENDGIKVHLITSGSAKADGHPAQPLSEEAYKRMKAEVDHLAEIFAEEVAVSRPLSKAQILALQAQTFIGTKAVEAGLADSIGTLADAVALAASLAQDKQDKKTMSAITELLGLDKAASEEQVCAAVKTLQTSLSKCLAASGSATADEAIGKTAAWQSKAEQWDATESRRAAEAAKAKADAEAAEKAAKEKTHAEAIARGQAEGKLTPHQAKHWAPTISTETLNTFLANAPVVVQVAAVAAVEAKPVVGKDMTYLGKSYEQLTNLEKHQLAAEDPAHFDAMAQDATKRGVR